VPGSNRECPDDYFWLELERLAGETFAQDSYFAGLVTSWTWVNVQFLSDPQAGDAVCGAVQIQPHHSPVSQGRQSKAKTVAAPTVKSDGRTEPFNCERTKRNVAAGEVKLSQSWVRS